ncbi:uncharacterized protein LOC113299323 [Papaver somniferum]|uniref:uncharacterized protein LOC113299323 n=1 Tax=Papaver somniferum TaxID=3469 RepID=UPI000E6FDDFC|nr:uncharacterized protein LOC113299323 [Papaver somniferum]
MVLSTKQSITVKVKEVLVTRVHAACLTVDRRSLWKDLKNINELKLPCLVIGDFNVVLSCEEKKGGRQPLKVAMQDFRDCIEYCNLIQSPRTGIKFSWFNNRVGKKRILCDLDRSFYNLQWLECYETWCYKVGVRGTSDHGALLGGVAQSDKPHNIPFRYQFVWTTHPGFLKVIQESWEVECEGNPAFCFTSKLKRLKEILKKWNWEVFGDLRVKVKTTEEAILKASLESDVDPENIKTVNFEEDLFEAIPNILNEEDNDLIDAFPSQEEIKNVVFAMDPNSAPGPYGFPGCFYKYAWEVVGAELMEAIQFCWRNRFIPKGFNSNFLFLLPKIQRAKKAEHFRPIGLPNFNFKIITIIITTRISRVLSRMISKQHGAFIKGRSIHEKIILASELVNELDTKRRGGNVGLKIDITQAYDSLSWEFLFEVLRRFGFSEVVIQWLKKIFESARIYVLINGGPCGFFEVGRGLRQGDPLSPIMFMLAE